MWLLLVVGGVTLWERERFQKPDNGEVNSRHQILGDLHEGVAANILLLNIENNGATD